MYVLGISCYYHDSSAALLKDGVIVAAAEEERFSRKKHDNSFPLKAIEYCLKSQKITINEVAHIGFYEKPLLKFERMISSHLEMFPKSFKAFLSSMPSWINEKLRITNTIKKKLKYKGDVLFIEHHLAHAASTFLVSPFRKAAILTVDGVGEWTTTAYGVGEQNNIHLFKELRFPHSIGLLYSTITAYLGMSVNNSEYKCLHPDTPVLLSNGTLVKINELFNLSGKKTIISESESINKLNKSIYLISLNNSTLKLEPHKTNIVYRKRAKTFLYEVELTSGRSVTVTANHKFTSVDSFGNIYCVEASKLKKNEFVLIPKIVSLKTSRLDKKKLLWAKLLAYSVAEGHELIRKEKHEAEIRIGISDDFLLNDIKQTVLGLNKTFRTWEIKQKTNLFYIGVSVWKDIDFLESIGYTFGKRAGSKEIPLFVMTASQHIKKEFLASLFDCDGSFTGHQITYISKSLNLINQIVYLLLSFGVHARIRTVFNKKYNQNYYRVEINGSDLILFQKNINFNLPIKALKLKNYINSIKSFGNNSNFVPINDYVLNKWISHGFTKLDLYKKIGNHFWDYETKKRYITPNFLNRVNKFLNNDLISLFQNGDVLFDRIKSIKKVKFDGFVYDVLMPKHHTLVGGVGGLILHNTMGLSAYGDMNKQTNHFYKKLKKVIDLKSDGSYRFDMNYFKYHYSDRMPSKKLCKLLGGPITKKDSMMTKRHKDIAAALQLITEEIMTKMLKHLHKETNLDSVVISGGVGLNSVYNGKILKNTPFKNIWLQPNASDGGTSIGVAVYIYHTILNHKRIFPFKSAFLGPSFSTRDIKAFLDENKIKYSVFKNEKELVDQTAKLIFKNNVVGWFQGRMEWGPRALGNRSILANPANPKAKQLLNEKVKHREEFRPFAPVVCEDDALTYFECDIPIPQPTDYMLMVYPIKKEWRKKIPSVTHINGSGRLQTIRKHQNPLYYNLIKRFGELSSIPILINTSFNIRGEPIVCTPYDSYKCMMGTGIDYLIIDKFLVKRGDNLQDAWDSETIAID